jgi:hypothetical protein
MCTTSIIAPKHQCVAAATRTDPHALTRFAPHIPKGCLGDLAQTRRGSEDAALSLNSPPHWKHRATSFKSLNPIGPMIHHHSALGQVFCAIVGGSHSVAFLMGKLALDDIRPKAHFI